MQAQLYCWLPLLLEMVVRLKFYFSNFCAIYCIVKGFSQESGGKRKQTGRKKSETHRKGKTSEPNAKT